MVTNHFLNGMILQVLEGREPKEATVCEQKSLLADLRSVRMVENIFLGPLWWWMTAFVWQCPPSRTLASCRASTTIGMMSGDTWRPSTKYFRKYEEMQKAINTPTHSTSKTNRMRHLEEGLVHSSKTCATSCFGQMRVCNLHYTTAATTKRSLNHMSNTWHLECSPQRGQIRIGQSRRSAWLHRPGCESFDATCMHVQHLHAISGDWEWSKKGRSGKQ